MGPLSGVRVIEIASLAPAPFGCMVLSDLGADVLRVDRAEQCGPDAVAPADPLARGRRSIGLNLKDPEGVGLLLRLHRAGGRAGGGVPARGGRAPRVRPRGVPAAQPAAGVRPDDRLGAAGAARADGRARHRLHRGVRGAARDRPGRRAAGAAAQPGRRLRRRWHAAGGRRARGAGRARAGPGSARWSTRPWWTARPC